MFQEIRGERSVVICLRLALGGRPRLTTALPSCALVNGCSIAGSGPIISAGLDVD